MPKTKKAATPVEKIEEPKVNKTIRFNAEHVRRAKLLALRKGVDFSAIVQMALAEKLERESE